MEKLIKDLNFYNTNNPKLHQKKHNHNGYQIIFVVSGSVVIEINGTEQMAKSPCIVFLNAFESHTLYNASGDYSRYVITLDTMLADKLVDSQISAMLKYRPYGFNHILFINEENKQDVTQMFHNIEREIEDKHVYRNTVLSIYVQLLLIFLYRLNPEEINRNFLEIFDIQSYIDTNFASIENLDVVAKKFFISPSCLSHKFKQKTGYSPHEYLTYTRLYNAQILLSTTNFSVQKICILCGFRDINNFIRQFKYKYGLAPLRYRKNFIN